ncbi:deoxyribodipyrimidine photo-lyase [Porticoccaceae bacterium LTM1]|nr:deoxyribodipyrimidine photo-lyase [Porticoccaceae bacterium LTM1]
MATTLVWFRNDLRVEDNSALWNAAQKGSVVGCFLLSPRQWRAHDMAGCRVDFILRTLRELKKSLNQLGIPLAVQAADSFDEAPNAVVELANQWQCSQVFWNDEYPLDERRRDDACESLLESAGLSVRRFQDALIAPPGTVTRNDGGPFKVFTPFKKVWLQLLFDSEVEELPAPSKQPPVKGEQGTVPDKLDGFESSVPAKLWPAGEKEAYKRLQKFVERSIEEYDTARDIPAEPGTSMLSPYLAVGAISARQCLRACLEANRGELYSGNRGIQTWLSELVWREFYQHVVVAFPHVCRNQPFKLETDSLPWRSNEVDFQRWCEGKTGVPLVDAGMRQLRETGWMHNRVRMVVAMFLSKNLLLDWRLGERFFMQHLIDGDFAANNGGWQWSASTGTDAVPYFRIFNPFTQGARFDPEGEYIHRYVPELRGVEPRVLHNPDKLQKSRPEQYPAIMVDIGASRERALAAFKGGK